MNSYHHGELGGYFEQKFGFLINPDGAILVLMHISALSLVAMIVLLVVMFDTARREKVDPRNTVAFRWAVVAFAAFVLAECGIKAAGTM